MTTLILALLHLLARVPCSPNLLAAILATVHLILLPFPLRLVLPFLTCAIKFLSIKKCQRGKQMIGFDPTPPNLLGRSTIELQKVPSSPYSPTLNP
jgi:hypothetical protein